MKLHGLLLLSVFLFASCGKQIESSSQEEDIAEASSSIDDRNYEKAIFILEPIHQANPRNELVKTKLLHAYAGAGGFEALKVLSISKEIEGLLKEFKIQQEGELEEAAIDGLRKLIAQVEKLVEPLPDLNPKQKKRLNQAIELYTELGLTLETAGKYNNFKWGTLHVFRLGVTVKELIRNAKFLSANTDSIDLKSLEEVILPQLKMLGKDIFISYKLFSNSFDKIQKITKSIDKLIAKTIGDKNFRLAVNVALEDEVEFFSALLKDNIHAASVLLRKLTEVYSEEEYKDKAETLAKALPSKNELNESAQRIEALFKVVLAHVTEEHPEVEAGLRSIFTEELKLEVTNACHQSIQQKNTNPLKELMKSKKPEVEVLESYYLILKGEIEENDLEEGLKAEIESLRKKVDLELLKRELDQIKSDVEEQAKLVEFGAEAVTEKNKEILAKRMNETEAKIESIENYLKNPIDELKESIRSENKDEETMQKIIDDTKEFVES